VNISAIIRHPRRERIRQRARHAIPHLAVKNKSAEAEGNGEDVSRANVLPIACCVVALGLGLRLAYYLINPAFTTDESLLALNLLHRSYGGLVDKLDFNQAAPLGFLFGQKLGIRVFGTSEYAMRLFPLASSVLATLLFYPVAARFVDRKPALYALGFFALSGTVLAYAATNKQYSVDVGATLALFGVAVLALNRLRWFELMLLTVVGGIAVWFSHPAIFVLAGAVSVLLLQSLFQGNLHRSLKLSIVVVVLLASFATSYLLMRSSLEHVQASFASDSAARPTTGGGIASDVGTVRSLLGIPHFGFAVRNALTLLGVCLCFVGFVVLFTRRRKYALLLVAPIPFVLLASAIGRYPVYPRTLLFLVPLLFILVGNGVHFLLESKRPLAIRLTGGVAFATLLIALGVAPVNHLRLRDGAEPKHAMRYLAANERPGDSLYVFSHFQYDFRYYLECGCFARASLVRRAKKLWPRLPAEGSLEQWSPALRSDPPWLVIGRSAGTIPNDYRPDLAALRGRQRVWILIAATPSGSREALLSMLNDIGRPKLTFGANNDVASVYLYDLSR
jgi:hypothetical protein